MIELKDITKVYQMGDSEFQALKGVSFKIEKGEFAAIVGPSGSGKSTTMHIIGLLDDPTSGTYTINNQNASDLDSSQRATMRNLNIGFVFQQFFLLPKLTALENVCLPLLYRDVPRKEAVIAALENLDKVGMKTYADHKPNELSGGQQQRVAIARALVGKPELILADEPTGALDSKTSQEVMEILKDLNKRYNTTVVVVTHDLAVAKQCPRNIRIFDGLVDETGEKTEAALHAEGHGDPDSASVDVDTAINEVPAEQNLTPKRLEEQDYDLPIEINKDDKHKKSEGE